MSEMLRLRIRGFRTPCLEGSEVERKSRKQLPEIRKTCRIVNGGPAVLLGDIMARRRRNGSDSEGLARMIVGILMLAALGIGGIQGFPQTLGALANLLLVVVLGGLAVLIVFLIARKIWRGGNSLSEARSYVRSPAEPINVTPTATVRNVPTSRPPPAAWNVGAIRRSLDEIDWYQFEKFCAALLAADGFVVERKGGAQPDGGVDLVVGKEGARALIQCKHWRTWTVQEKIVREMLGSMTHHGVRQGAIYTLKGWTEPAARFAVQHDITLVNGDELAQSAAVQLTPSQLDTLLNSREHHCPKCESPMLWKEGDFTPFWGCSRFPACRGKLNYSGAR